MPKMNSIRLSLTLPALLLAANCGGSSFSKEDAARATTVVQTTINKAIAAAPRGLTQEQTTSVMIDYTYSCSGGGTAKVAGTVQGGGASGAYDVDATFTGCMEEGITLDGTLKYKFGITTTGTSVGSFEFTMKGTITYTGSISGECEFDFAVEGTGSGGAVKGSVCGVDVEEAGIRAG